MNNKNIQDMRPTITGNVQPLGELQRQQLIARINNLPMSSITPYFMHGHITLAEVPNINEERRTEIEKMLASRPNPIEQADWQASERVTNQIDSMTIDQLKDTLQLIDGYISKWESIRPAGNHVDDAQRIRNIINKKIMDIEITTEDKDWQNVNKNSISELLAHNIKYSNSVHASEIDNMVWALTVGQNFNVSIYDLNNYITNFPNGIHRDEATRLSDAIGAWDNAKNSSDLFEIHNYLRNNPGSPFEIQAREILMSLKNQEIWQMRNCPTGYARERLIRIVTEGIISENELINEHITTPSILNLIKSPWYLTDLPDIKKTIIETTTECKEGHTDVFFFGIPSTGKSCILMGLSNAGSLQINFASGGGDYAMALQQYTAAGVTIPPTKGDFVTTLETTISSRENGDNIQYKVNLVEMSGEEFAFGIANNPQHEYNFESMASGTTALLRNDNNKVFFLIIDPTTDIVRIQREVEVGKDINGNPIKRLEYCAVNQLVLIQKIVNIFQDPGNAEIMKRVDSIHIIMTKADTLGAPLERDNRAYDIFQQKYASRILDPLVDLCKEYNINSNTEFHPKLYTFSLGTFYAGNFYEYEQGDSDRLINAIKNSVHATKKKSWLDRFKDTLN